MSLFEDVKNALNQDDKSVIVPVRIYKDDFCDWMDNVADLLEYSDDKALTGDLIEWMDDIWKRLDQ